MIDLFIDCPTGLAGDMLLAGFLDLGIPISVIEKPLHSIGLANSYKIIIEDKFSYGLLGKKVRIIEMEDKKEYRQWSDIKKIIINSDWEKSLKDKVFQVFESLAEVEAKVHGSCIDQVHFHEISAIDSLVDVIGVCKAVDYLNPNQIICANPPAGSGTVMTSHGILPVPVPAVVELAKKFGIKLISDESFPQEELTTPTGLALMAVLSTGFGRPSYFSIDSTGNGIGHNEIDRANLLRIFKLKSNQECTKSSNISWQNLIVQEAWIDDASAEDIANFCNQLRDSGAIEVVTQSVQMKKNRQGTVITAISNPEISINLRDIWLTLSTTIGLRERSEGRWVLPRRIGQCMTTFGTVSAKQILRPDGKPLLKAEHDELIRLSEETGKSIYEVRKEIALDEEHFEPEEKWSS